MVLRLLLGEVFLDGSSQCSTFFILMGNTCNCNSGVFGEHIMLKIKNGNKAINISFQEPPHWTCLGTKMKMELYVSSVTGISFSSELGCHTVAITLLILSFFLEDNPCHYCSPSLTQPQSQYLTSMSLAFSNIFSPSSCPQKDSNSQLSKAEHTCHLHFVTSLLPPGSPPHYKALRSLCSWFNFFLLFFFLNFIEVQLRQNICQEKLWHKL